MKKLLLILTLCSQVLPGFGLNDGPGTVSTYNSSGFINVTVLSNINKESLQCDLKQVCLSLGDGPEAGNARDISVSRIIVPVKEFKCTNRFVYKDFLTLLKANQYPTLEIDILNNPDIESHKLNSVTLKDVTITVAGVSKQFDINCTIRDGDNNNQILNGSALIKLTDLDIVPPVKMFGLVKVENEITINFEFCLKYLN